MSETLLSICPKITDIHLIRPFHARVTIEPLERGFGHTLGNALRRVMISSIPGFGLVEVKIDGVTHEYDRVEGMREDVTWFLLHLRKVVFKIKEGDQAVLTLKKEGPCKVTAGDIQLPHNVEILNKDHVLAVLTKKGKLDVELTIEKGMGFQLASSRHEKNGEGEKRFGVIYLDTIFTPIQKVAFQVENVRVGNRTDLDRLLLDIETNGIFSFEEIIEQASTILIQHFRVFSKIGENPINVEQLESSSQVSEAVANHPLFSEELETIELTSRARKCLHLSGIRYVGDLVQKTEKELMGTPNLGKKSLVEIKAVLAERDLKLGMIISDWTSPSSVTH